MAVVVVSFCRVVIVCGEYGNKLRVLLCVVKRRKAGVLTDECLRILLHKSMQKLDLSYSQVTDEVSVYTYVCVCICTYIYVDR